MSAATKKLRAAVFKRADNSCECGCGQWIDEESGQMDHALSRRVPETLQNCWALTESCHRFRTLNWPSSAHWLQLFGEHCKKYGYAAELKVTQDRFAFVTARGAA